ncbi:MAG: DUF167 domain-containing protein [Phycisphaerae bacterium]|jgi:uncharacterized protein (TIGR00251 family)
MLNEPDLFEVIEHEGGVEFHVKVVPGASRTRVMGLWGTALKVAVAAPPEGGKANAAVVALLAKTLEVSRGAVRIVSGQTQPRKRVSVAGLTAEAVRERLP